MKKLLMFGAAVFCLSSAAHAADNGTSGIASSTPKAQAICKFADLKKQQMLEVGGIKVLVPFTGDVNIIGDDVQDVTSKLLALGIGTADRPCLNIEIKSTTGGFSNITTK